MISGSSVIIILKNKMLEASFQSLLYSAHESIQKKKIQQTNSNVEQ